MNIKDISATCMRLKNKFRKNEKKLNTELTKLINFVDVCDLFKGKKRKTKTLIRSFMVKQ